MGRNSCVLHRGNMNDRCWVWYIWLCGLLVLVLIGRLAPRWKPDGNNHVNGLDDVNSGGNGDVLSPLQGHGGRQGQEGAESECCG